MNCHNAKSSLPDLLLDPAAVPAGVRLHLENCSTCREELHSLQATMHLLDDWSAPEPSPYFDVRMQARLRAAKEEAPAGLWQRLQAYFLFNTNVHLRTAGAAALAAVLAIGGGSALYQTHEATHVPQTQASATVRDLQSLDGNAQVFQQLNALDTDDGDPGSTSN